MLAYKSTALRQHLLSLVVPFKLLGKFGNFRILRLAEKVPCRAWGLVNAPGRVRVLGYVRLGKIRFSQFRLS
jgi:hypothetical protein